MADLVENCILSSGRPLIYLQCPQNSKIPDKGRRETCVFNVGVAWWSPQIMLAYPKNKNPKFSNLLPQLSFIKPQFSIVNSSVSILTQTVLKIVWLPTKCPQAPLALLAAFSRSGWLERLRIHFIFGLRAVILTFAVGVLLQAVRGCPSSTVLVFLWKTAKEG